MPRPSLPLFDSVASPVLQSQGGFCCIPGTHKGNVPLPASWRDLSKGVHPKVTRVPASAGDVIIFTEALTHGTLPWEAEESRTTLFYKFSPHGTTWSSDWFDPEDYAVYADVDDRMLAILEPPNARYRGRHSKPRWRKQATAAL